MTHRDRAWRRRKSRIVDHKVEATKDWLAPPISDASAKPHSELKQHQPGKLTHIQAMRQDWQLRDDTQEGSASDGVI